MIYVYYHRQTEHKGQDTFLLSSLFLLLRLLVFFAVKAFLISINTQGTQKIKKKVLTTKLHEKYEKKLTTNEHVV